MNKFAAGAILGLASLATIANAGVDMDHTNPQGANLTGTNGFGVNQIFGPGFEALNGAVIDDFVASGTNIVRVQAAFEVNLAGAELGITNWHLAIFSSVTAAGNSTGALIGDVINVDLGVPGGYTNLTGTGAFANPVLVDFSGLNIAGLTAGTQYWMALVPELDVVTFGQSFLMSSTAPNVLGAGTNNDAFGINPGNAFGLGTTIPIGTNAGLYMETAAVPEPASMAALGLGALALIRRRRNAKKA